jgi:hypothetical protein
LVEVGVHMLLHGFAGEFCFQVLLIELGLGLVDLKDYIFDLLHC